MTSMFMGCLCAPLWLSVVHSAVHPFALGCFPGGLGDLCVNRFRAVSPCSSARPAAKNLRLIREISHAKTRRSPGRIGTARPSWRSWRPWRESLWIAQAGQPGHGLATRAGVVSRIARIRMGGAEREQAITSQPGLTPHPISILFLFSCPCSGILESNLSQEGHEKGPACAGP